MITTYLVASLMRDATLRLSLVDPSRKSFELAKSATPRAELGPISVPVGFSIAHTRASADD